MISAAYDSGHWSSLVNNVHSQQLFKILSCHPDAVVDPDTSMYAHAFLGSLVQAAKNGVTDVSEWPRRKIEFARSHCSKHKLWYNPRLKQLRPITALRLYDKASILTKLRSAPSTGLLLDDVVKEYTQAYLDVHDLISQRVVCQFDGTIWLCPQNT